MSYSNIRTLEDDPDAYAARIHGVIQVVDYAVGRDESTTRLEMLMRAYHRLAFNTSGGEVAFEDGTLTANFSPRDWETFAVELGIALDYNGHGFSPRRESTVDNLGTPSLRRRDPSQSPRFTMKVVQNHG